MTSKQSTLPEWVYDYRIAQGGLMRCCLESLNRQVWAMTERPTDGMTLDCEFEKPGNENLILDSFTWRWNRDKHFSGDTA